MISNLVTCFDPIFVVGCPRSGTSILSHTLSKHSENWLSAESDFMIPLLNAVEPIYQHGTIRDNMHWLIRQKVTLKEFTHYIFAGINALYSQRSGGKRWVEQTPAYTIIINKLAEILPNASFIHIKRDGRKVVNSMINSNFDQEWSSNFTKACQTWNDYLQILIDFEDKHPERIITVKNEDLKADPEKVIKSICGFLQIEYEEQMLTFINSRQDMNSSFASNNKSNTWEESWHEDKLKKFNTICGDTMKKLGYR